METVASTAATSPARATNPADRLTTIRNLLKYTYGLVPIVAGLDKFSNLLTDWSKYLAPAVTDMLPFQANTFMYLVGVIEVIAGILVFLKPKIGSLIVSLWLIGIAINLLLTGQYYDIAVRDVVMAIGAFSLYLLLQAKGER